MAYFEGLIPGDNNLGSISKVMLIPMREVLQIAKPKNNFRLISMSDITLEPGSEWIYPVYTIDNCQLKQVSKETDAGIIYTYTLQFNIARNKENKASSFEFTETDELLVIIYDANGDGIVLGWMEPDEKYGMKLTNDYTSGKMIKESNTDHITLKTETLRRFYHLSAS